MKMNKKRKSTSSSATQVKNWQKTISTDDKLEVLSQLEKGEQIVNICHNVRLNHSNIVQFMVLLIQLQKKLSGTKVFGSKRTIVLSE